VTNQVECHLVLTDFPLAFQELGRLQREDPALAGIVAQLEKGDILGGTPWQRGYYTVAVVKEVIRSLWFQQR
jgi:hypothetical protein